MVSSGAVEDSKAQFSTISSTDIVMEINIDRVSMNLIMNLYIRMMFVEIVF